MKETAEHFVTAIGIELSNSDDCFHDAEALAFDGNLKEAAKMYKQSRKHFNNAVKYAKEWKDDYIEKKNSVSNEQEMIIAAANAGAEQNFTIWKANAIEEIEKLPIFSRIEEAKRVEYINRTELLTKLRK